MNVYYIYVLLLSILGLIDVSTKNSKNTIILLQGILIIFFVGFRYKVGIDWLFYYNLYTGSATLLAIEPGFNFLSGLFYLLDINYWLFQAFITLVVFFALLKFFRYYTDKYVFCLSGFFILAFGFNAEAIRQVLALAIVCLGYVQLINRNNKVFYVYVFLAALFHVSALIIIIVPLYLRNKTWIKITKIVCIIGTLLLLIDFHFIDYLISLFSMISGNRFVEKILWYGDSSNAGSVLTFSLIFKILVVICYELILGKTQRKESNYNVNEGFILSLVYILLFIDIFLGRYGTISSRLDVYFTPAFLILIVYMLNRIKFHGRVFIYIIFLILFFLIFYRFTENSYFKEQFEPYRNYIVASVIYDDSYHREESVKQFWAEKGKQ